MKIRYILLLALFPVFTLASPEDAEAVTKRYVEAVTQFDAAGIADTLHTEQTKFYAGFLRHIYEQSEESEKKSFLESFGLESEDALLRAGAKEVTESFFRTSFERVSPQAKEFSKGAVIEIVGSVEKQGDIYVVYKLLFGSDKGPLEVPDVLILRIDGKELKVLSGSQMRSIKEKMEKAGYKN